MAADFWIECGNPRTLPGATGDDLRTVIENRYPLHTDDAVLYWGGQAHVLSYKYDLCLMWDDIVEMIACVLDHEDITTLSAPTPF